MEEDFPAGQFVRSEDGADDLGSSGSDQSGDTQPFPFMQGKIDMLKYPCLLYTSRCV